MIEEIRRRGTKMKTTLLDAGMTKLDMDQAAQAAASCGSIVIAAYVTVGAYRGNVALPGEFSGFVNTLLAGNTPVTLIALGSPYLVRSFSNAKAYAATFSTTTTSETAVVKAMFGEIPISGRLPVTIPGIGKIGDGIQLPATRPAAKPASSAHSAAKKQQHKGA